MSRGGAEAQSEKPRIAAQREFARGNEDLSGACNEWKQLDSLARDGRELKVRTIAETSVPGDASESA